MRGSASLPFFMRELSSTRKRKVAIIGLNKGSIPKIIDNEFSKKLDITFFPSDSTSNSIQKMGKTDLIILMTGFISHNTAEVVKRCGKPFQYVSGSTSSLKRVLNNQ